MVSLYCCLSFVVDWQLLPPVQRTNPPTVTFHVELKRYRYLFILLTLKRGAFFLFKGSNKHQKSTTQVDSYYPWSLLWFRPWPLWWTDNFIEQSSSMAFSLAETEKLPNVVYCRPRVKLRAFLQFLSANPCVPEVFRRHVNNAAINYHLKEKPRCSRK